MLINWTFKEFCLIIQRNLTKLTFQIKDGVVRCLVEEFGLGSKCNFYKIELKGFVAEFRVITKQLKVKSL